MLAPVLDDPALPVGFAPRYNIAPTQTLPIVANREKRVIELARWGLVPTWADDLSIGARLINARGESLSQKPAFRDAFARRRCLVPADGFFEWKRAGKKKQPHFIHPSPRRAFAFAGLWASWRAPDQTWVISYTIVTCPASPLIAPLHDRMPVVVAPEDFDRWLTREPLDPDALQDIVAPADPAGWIIEPVSEAVNRVENDGPECLAQVTPSVQGSLF